MINYTVRVHHPTISEEERARRIEDIKKALIEFEKERIRNGLQNNKARA